MGSKRAGRKKHRNGSGPLKPSPGRSVPPAGSTLVEDNLPANESLKLELRALREGWLLDSHGQTRKLLMLKIASIATTSKDNSLVIRAFQALVAAEQRERSLELQERALALRKSGGDLPDQVQVQDKPTSNIEHIEPWRVIQDLLGNQNVIDAIVTKSAPGE